MADVYSKRNRLANNDAEDGDTTGWTAAGASVVSGGPGESLYCFQLNSTGSMSQSIPATTQPPDVKVGGYFLPEYPTTEPEKKVFIRVISAYGEGTDDINLIPCVESGGALNDVV